MGNLTAAQILQFASLLIGLGVQVIEKRAADEGKTVEEILLEANETWNQAQIEAEELLNQHK